MSYFYGKLLGARIPKTVTAHKTTGITAIAMSYGGDISVDMRFNPATGKIDYIVLLRSHETGATIERLASGELEG